MYICFIYYMSIGIYISIWTNFSVRGGGGGSSRGFVSSSSSGDDGGEAGGKFAKPAWWPYHIFILLGPQHNEKHTNWNNLWWQLKPVLSFTNVNLFYHFSRSDLFVMIWVILFYLVMSMNSNFNIFLNSHIFYILGSAGTTFVINSRLGSQHNLSACIAETFKQTKKYLRARLRAN